MTLPSLTRRRMLLAGFAVATALAASPGVASAATSAGLTVHAKPGHRTVCAGQTAKYTVVVTGDTTGGVGLSLFTDGLPNDINFFFTPNPTEHTATLVVQTRADTKPGRYTLRIGADTVAAHVRTKVVLVVLSAGRH
jgi:hypothetical protein